MLRGIMQLSSDYPPPTQIPAPMPIYKMPICRIELAIQCLIDGQLSTLLVRRQASPYQGYWALPGGVIRLDLDTDLDQAAKRVARERLTSSPPNLRQLVVVGAAGRDPRGAHAWGLSVIYRALLAESPTTLGLGKRVAEIKWVPSDGLPSRMAFDHATLVRDAINTTREEITNLKFPVGFAPKRFTLGELQSLCEAVLGQRLDKASFRRKLIDRHLVEPIAGKVVRGNAHRPALIYRLKG